MIENILKLNNLSLIIIYNKPNMSHYFLNKYVRKITHKKVFPYLNKYKDIIPFIRKNFKNKDFKDPYLFTACNCEYFKVVKLLLEQGANVHSLNDCAVRWLSEYGNYKVVKLLLEVGANVNAQNDYPLRYASENGHLKVVKILLEKGAAVNSLINDYPLCRASRTGKLKVVKILLDNRADVHAEYDCALRMACFNGNLKIARILLENGAVIHGQNDDFLNWGIKYGHSEIIKLLNIKLNR